MRTNAFTPFIFFLFLLPEIYLKAQEIKVVQPESLMPVIGRCDQVGDGYYLMKLADKAFSSKGSGYIKTDRNFKILSTSYYPDKWSYTMEFRMEAGNSFYFLGTKYDTKANRIDFVYTSADNLSAANVYHSINYSYKKEGGNYLRFTGYCQSVDKKRFLLIWKNTASDKKEYTIYEFDSSFKLMGQYQLATGLSTDLKSKGYMLAEMDSMGRLIMLMDEKDSDPVIVTYSLVDKSLLKQPVKLSDKYNHLSVSFDKQHSILFINARLRNPPHLTHVGIVLDNDGPAGVGLNLRDEDIAKFYVFDVGQQKLSETPIRFTPELVDRLYDPVHVGKGAQPRNTFFTAWTSLDLIGNGNCAITFAMNYHKAFTMNGESSEMTSNMIAIVINGKGEKIAAHSLYRKRTTAVTPSWDDKTADAMVTAINNKLYIFCNMIMENTPPSRLDPWYCYRIDESGNVEVIKNTPDFRFSLIRGQNNTGYIPVMQDKTNKLVLLDCK